MARIKDGWSACKELKEKSLMKPTTVVQSRIKTLVKATNKNEFIKAKAELKAQLPVMTRVGLRRYQLPYYEALILELEEAGMQESADFLQHLVDKSPDDDGLKNHPHLLDRIKIGLIEAEQAQQNCQQIDKTSANLRIALFFQSLTPNWFWIADEFYTRALATAENIEKDDGQILNTIKFLYGKYLYNVFKNSEDALYYLNAAWKASKESKHWNAANFLGIKQDNLFQECNNLLYQVLIDLAERSRKAGDESSFAMKAAVRALKHAIDSGFKEYIAKALYELGKCQLACGDIERALNSFSKYLAQVKRIKDPEAIANGYKELAFAHQKLEDDAGTMKLLSSFKKTAEDNKLPEKLAKAYFYTGEYLLQQKKSKLATAELEMAFELFKSLGKIKKMDRARFLIGISRGQELEDKYLKLISKSNENKNAMKMLLEWKNGTKREDITFMLD